LLIERPTIVYAPGCRFCRACARLIHMLDRSDSLAFVSLTELAAERLLPDLTFEERVSNWHLVTREGRDLVEGEAILFLLEHIPATRWLGRAARALHVEGVLSRFDQLLSARRGRWGRYAPDVAPPLRFP
jgi:predicted DCC family thiol-disulfide oxidoreductase YuxK